MHGEPQAAAALEARIGADLRWDGVAAASRGQCVDLAGGDAAVPPA